MVQKRKNDLVLKENESENVSNVDKMYQICIKYIDEFCSVADRS